MSVVDILKRGHRYAIGVLSPPPVVFHHVPKCGGTSVGRALRRRYILSQQTVLPEESFRAFETFTGRRDREQMLIDALDLRDQILLCHVFCDVHCVSAHVRFSNSAYNRFKDRYRFITLLREPVPRFISHYFWGHDQPQAHARIEEDFEAFLGTARAKRLGATYVEYFCGLPKGADITGSEAIEAAKNNLKLFDVVGRLDDLPAFEGNLKQLLGAHVRIGYENKAKQLATVRKSTVTPELRRRVEELCAPDLAIWQSATQK